MSNNRGGFFSLNRFLGRKQKTDKSSTNGFSKSSVQTLTRSTTNLEEISPQNKITPLTTVHNAPFEQTFRITVYLPMNQLYVSRIGAKTKLCELLNMICVNKLLDSSKFEFRHPVDDSQVFDSNRTIGEVGLSEIKLAHKNGKEDTTVRYRMHTNGHENRLRPHTMSSVSPYSSTNSLNSSDSIGLVNQRLSGGHVPAVPGRKKRVAPRPPSQNSISEDPDRKSMERSSSQIDQSELNQTNLNRQNFHVSSPNLSSMNNNLTLKSYSNSYSSTDTSISNSLDGRQSDNIVNNNKRIALSRPLSLQPKSSFHENDEYKYQRSESINSVGYRSHSRTSSETSDITRDRISPEPQPRKRPPIGKKKAPAPPPRTVSNVSTHHGPIATPRCLQKLNEEEMKDENGNIETVNSSNVHKEESKPITTESEPPKHSLNVSKVMLNVNEVEPQLTENGNNKTDKPIQSVVNTDLNSARDEILNNSTVHFKCSLNKKTATVEGNKTKPKKVSVVDFRVSNSQPEIDENDISKQVNEIIDEAVKINEAKLIAEYDISKQVNEIIDEAVKINEAKLNAENERKNGVKNVSYKQTNEINNNNDNNKNVHNFAEKENGIENQAEVHPNFEMNKSILKRNVSPEIPIQPIINEIRTFDFQEYSDNSLPASTTSTLNTTETPSTGPESLITSDIEDGYKGNDVEKKRKAEPTYEDSKEDFIESQFGFLSEHLDSKMNIDSDDEKTVGSIKITDAVSSTMINNKFGQTFKTSPTVEKKDVIDELTQIINCNRLETFIKPNNDTNKQIEVAKRSSLKNFHIGAYSNDNNENNKIDTINDSTNDNQIPEHKVRDNVTFNSTVRQDDSIKIPKDLNSDTFVIPKPVGRSLSFHSTIPGINDRVDNTNLPSDLSAASRSFSYISLNGSSKHETNNNQTSDLNESTRKKSVSELSIADTPSLQSIEVMKSILNNSRSKNLDCTPETQKTVEPDNQRNLHENEEKAHKEDLSASNIRNEPKTWKYQGPPSINVSTWGERPKSQVYIKSDNDYIFGGSSKMAALQKRFSESNEQKYHNNDHSSVKPFKKQTEHCENSTCKLPVVRGVEYKKNIPLNNKDPTSEDTQDSIQRSFRPNYHEISCIISQKPPPEKTKTGYTTMTLNRNINSKYSSDSVPAKSILKSSQINRAQSYDGQQGIQSSEQSETLAKNNKSNGGHKIKDPETDVSDKLSTKKLEKPMFSQFTLRKTGLKEKILDESNVTKNTANHNDCSKSAATKHKVNAIPTAPKPPPLLKKPLVKPIAKGNSTEDPRTELLNSIRSFNRDALKRNCIY